MKTVITTFLILVSISAYAETKRECHDRISKDIANRQITCLDKGYSCEPTKEEICDILKECKNEKTKNVNAIRNKILKKGFKKKL